MVHKMGCCCSCCINTYLNTFRHHAEILRGWTYRSCQRLIWFYLGRCTFVRRLLVYIGLWQTLGVCGKLSTFRLCGAGVAHSGSSYFSSEHNVYPPAGWYRVLSLLLLCGRCENGVNYTLMSNAGCVAAAQNIQWTIV